MPSHPYCVKEVLSVIRRSRSHVLVRVIPIDIHVRDRVDSQQRRPLVVDSFQKHMV